MITFVILTFNMFATSPADKMMAVRTTETQPRRTTLTITPADVALVERDDFPSAIV